MRTWSSFILGVVVLGAAAHAAPRVAILAPTTAAVGDDVVLESQVLDPGEGDLSYAWHQASGATVTLTSRNQRNTSFIVPMEAAGSRIVIQLIAADRLTSSEAASATISIAGSATPNKAPVASPGGSLIVTPGASVVLDGTGSSDPDGDALTYSWQQISGTKATITGADTAKAKLTAPKNVARQETLNVKLTVTDTRSATGSAAVSVVVQPAGCGCSAGGGEMGLLVVVGLALRRRRYRS